MADVHTKAARAVGSVVLFFVAVEQHKNNEGMSQGFCCLETRAPTQKTPTSFFYQHQPLFIYLFFH